MNALSLTVTLDDGALSVSLTCTSAPAALQRLLEGGEPAESTETWDSAAPSLAKAMAEQLIQARSAADQAIRAQGCVDSQRRYQELRESLGASR